MEFSHPLADQRAQLAAIVLISASRRSLLHISTAIHRCLCTTSCAQVPHHNVSRLGGDALVELKEASCGGIP